MNGISRGVVWFSRVLLTAAAMISTERLLSGLYLRC
jgi:hypothetical protein